MFIYNITTKVDNEIADKWIQWQKEIHIPEILSTGFFYDSRFYELLGQDDEEGRTFVVQYFVLEREHYDEYILLHAPFFRDKAFQKWGNQFLAFKSLLQSVD